MRSRLLIASMLALALVSAVVAAIIVNRNDGAAADEAAAGRALIGGPFTLVDQSGATVTEADFAGEWMLIYFGYTYCPDVCPVSLQVMMEAIDELPSEVAGAVRPVFITVDPERDTVPLMADYVGLFGDRLVGLTGTPEQVDAVKKAWRVYARKAEETGTTDYLVDHSSFTYLMGPDGAYVAHFGHDATPEEMAARIEEAVHAG